MTRKILHLLTLLLLLPWLLACSSDDGYPTSESFRTRPMRFEGELLGYGTETRAQGIRFPEGAMLYLELGNVKTTAVYENGTWMLRLPDDFSDEASGSCTAYYFEQAQTEQTEVGLSASSVVYKGTGSYHNGPDVLSVTATVRPLLPRLHFRGTPGTRIAVSGLKGYSAFSASSHAFTATSWSATVTVQSDGYTPYVYAELFSDRTLTLTDGTYTYSRSFGESVMRPGESGFIDIPTPASCEGWTTDAAPTTDVDATIDNYDGDDQDWNQPDKEPTTDITVGGSDYDEDEDYNQPDKDPTSDIDASTDGYEGDQDWNQPDKEPTTDITVGSTDYDEDEDYNKEDPGMPTDISLYSDMGIVKVSSDNYNINIPVSYLAYQNNSYTGTSYIVVFLTSPSGKSYNITGNLGNPRFSDYKHYDYQLVNGYIFIDLQAKEKGVWHLRLVQTYAGVWKYYYSN